jgi:hypothetical protein
MKINQNVRKYGHEYCKEKYKDWCRLIFATNFVEFVLWIVYCIIFLKALDINYLIDNYEKLKNSLLVNGNLRTLSAMVIVIYE